MEEMELSEKAELINDTLTKALERYVDCRDVYVQLANERYSKGYTDAPLVYRSKFEAYQDAKQLLIDLMFANCTTNQMLRTLDDFELI